MSPEQVRGRPADPRSDIFSFGAILYEMLSGRRAFHGDTSADTISAILKEDPPDLSATNRQISPGLDRIVRHCLEKDPEQRFQSARDLAFDLEALSDVSAPSAVSIRQPRKRDLRIGVPLILALLAVAAAAILFRPRTKAIDSLAVLPFANARSDPNTDYLSDGITENLISRLSRSPALTVMSRSSVFRYKGREIDAQAVGRELKVQAVLMGRVEQRGANLLISAELVDVRSNRQIWGDQFNRKASDIQAVQEQIAKDIAGTLRLPVTSEENKRLTKRYTENAEAYELYLRGRYHWNKRTGEDIQKGIEYFRQAIEKDPAYAQAYAGLADSYVILFQYAALPSRETFPKGKAAALKALEIDDTLAQAHASLGFANECFDWDFAAAEKEYRRAIELDPKYATARHWYSLYLAHQGRFDEAIREAERALELDPLALILNNLLPRVLCLARQYDRSIDAAHKTLELDQGFYIVRINLGIALEQKERFAEAIAEFEEAARLSRRTIQAIAGLGHGYAVSGRRAEAFRLIDELKRSSERGYDPLASIALVYAGLGENDEAIKWLEKAFDAHSGFLIEPASVKMDARWDALRSDPRFQNLLRRIGFSP
jgi:TolB-like protein/Flp pilus assembly protein TadD